MNRTRCNELVAELGRYGACTNDEQRAHVVRIADFVRSCDAPWQRSTLQGHLTASAWIVDDACEHALLVHHKKLGCWLQPGGHVDDDDQTFLEAARREAREETGLNDLTLVSLDAAVDLYDVDVHAIPARRDEPEHFHYDLRFCFVAKANTTTSLNADESNDLRWFALREIATDSSMDASVRRMAALTLKWPKRIVAMNLCR